MPNVRTAEASGSIGLAERTSLERLLARSVEARAKWQGWLDEFPVFDIRSGEIVGFRYSAYACYANGEGFLRWCFRPAERISRR